MNTSVMTEIIEELPWGAGYVVLLEAMTVNVETKTSPHPRVTIWSDELDTTGDGETFEDALLDFGKNLEILFDDLTSVDQNVLSKSDQKLLERFDIYFPEEVVAGLG